MDRVLCVILCMAVIVVSIYILGYCGGVSESLEAENTEPTVGTEPETLAITEPPAVVTEPPLTETTEPPTEETEPPVILYDVPLSEELQLHIIGLCEEKYIDPAIVMAMIFRESSFRADVIGDNGDSYGLMQIQPKWNYDRMQKLGCTDLLDPFQNVTVGVDILAEQIARYDGDITKALVAYNRGHYDGIVTQYAENVLAYAESIKN